MSGSWVRAPRTRTGTGWRIPLLALAAGLLLPVGGCRDSGTPPLLDGLPDDGIRPDYTEPPRSLTFGAWTALFDEPRLVGVPDVPYVAPFFDERRVGATVDGSAVDVDVVLNTAGGDPVPGELALELQSLDGTVLGNARTSFHVHGLATVTLRLDGLPADATLPGLAGYRLAYDLHAPGVQLAGHRSLFEAVGKLEVQVLTAGRYATGEKGFLRLFARDPGSGSPAAGARVRAAVVLPDGREAPVAEGTTDAFGALQTELVFPADYEGDAKLVLSVEEGETVELAEADVSILPDARVLLTTDKPLYQPGQTIHLRALALDRAHKTPMGTRELVFEVTDAAGNKVFKERHDTNEFGIASADFRLATQVNMGAFRVKAVVGEVEVEKEVTVDRYVLPKYKIEATLDHPYYLPGQTARGTISAQYFFGQPVSGGTVKVVASTYDIGFTPFSEVTGTTNAEGLWSFEFTMPSYVVGQPLEQGKGLVKVDVTVTDQADHEQTLTKTTLVAKADVELVLVPESGELVPGVENQVYVVVSDPIGGPLAADVTITAEGTASTVTLDEHGLGVWTVTPTAVPLVADVTVVPAEGQALAETVTLEGGGKGRTVLLRTDGALYQVGETVFVSVLLPLPSARVYVDVIHAGRTVATETVPVTDGLGTWSFETDETLEGALQLHAYFLGEDSDIVRDERLLYVNPSDALRVTLTPDQEIYGPGAPATIDVAVTDAEGQPKAAAVGMQVVDEAVFALQEVQPGLLKVYFELEEALATPKYQFAWPDLQPESIIEDADTPSGGGGNDGGGVRAEVAFAAQAGGGPAYGVDLNTHRKRLKDVLTVVKPYVQADLERFKNDAMEAYQAGTLTYENVDEYVATLDETDPWDNAYRFVQKDPENFEMASSGPDELVGTNDDVALTANIYEFLWGWGMVEDGDWDAEGGGPPMAGGGGEPAPNDGTDESGDDSGSGPRIRSFFPETLYVNPAVITDETGHAAVDLTMADSITSWRMTALANSMDGLLGSTVAAMTVFQDFFVDIDFPATLTRGDAVSVPVAVYNYLDIPQTVTLRAQAGDWFELVNGGEVTVPLDAGQVDAVYFDVRVTAVGTHGLTVIAEGSAMSDGIQRTVRVEPDGKEFTETVSARFHTEAPAEEVATETVAETIVIPEDNIDGAEILLVKVYPGFFSQCVEGLDSMLRLPDG